LFTSTLLPKLRKARTMDVALDFDAKQAGFLKDALRMALWDLAAKAAGQSVAALLAGLRGAVPQTKVPCYGSTLDYPSSEADAQALTAKYAGMDIGRIKVKVGAPDVRRDIRRLLATREAAGEHVTLTADANEAWDADTCLSRLHDYEKAGIRLGYIEDPLPRDDWEGYATLRVQSPVPVAAHDYFTEIAQYQRAAESRLFDFFRSGQDTAHQIRIAELGAHYGIPVYYGNSIMEQNIQAAAGLGCTVMIEFSDIAWWRISGRPPRIEDGFEFVPEAHGFGLDADPDALTEFHHPAQSETVSLPCPFPNE
jgi:L-alanine-DL-glutamate epimerase-like enolase superfamily enzyme